MNVQIGQEGGFKWTNHFTKLKVWAYRNVSFSLKGGSGPKFSKTFSEITVDPKVTLDGATFRLGLEARDPLASAWRPHPFSRQKLNFSKKGPNHDFSSLIDR